MWVFAFAPELSTARLVVYTRDWVFAPTLELHLSHLAYQFISNKLDQQKRGIVSISDTV